MDALDDVDQLIKRYQLALDEFMKGNPEPVNKVWSHREDVTLANGTPARGWEQVSETMEHGAAQLRDGEITSFEVIVRYVTAELAYMVWIERQQARLGGRQDVTPFTLRVTMIFRPEDGVEDSASACRPHNHPSASRIGDPGATQPLERPS